MKSMFYTAAVFTLACCISTAFFLPETYGTFGVDPVPGIETHVVIGLSHMFAALLFAFAVSYFWIAVNPKGNIPLIRMGILAKMSIVVVTTVDIVSGIAPWQTMVPVSGDLIYSILFFIALRRLQYQQ